MTSHSRARKPPKICPVCGEDVPARALACPECGADHNSGWRDDACDGVDMPGQEFDYDDFVKREFGTKIHPRNIHPIWWITAIILLIAFLRWALL